MPRARLTATIVLSLHAADVLAQTPPPGFTYQTISDNSLQLACSMAFTPDGRLFLCERTTGNIRVVADGVLSPASWATVPCANNSFSEHGLLGIAIDPAFLTNGYVYVYYTTADQLQNRIARLQDVGGSGTGFTILTPNNAIPTGGAIKHNGGRMVFGRDGTLFVGTGDRYDSSTAPSLASWNGKILRFEVPNLTIPATNPFPGSPIYSYGHRNHFGLCVHPVSGDLFQTEVGDLLADELNRIVAGGNYGWPTYEGPEPVPDPTTVDPVAFYSPTPDPTGTCFYSGTNYPPSYSNSLFFVEFTDGLVNKVDLNAAGTAVVAQSVFDDLGQAYDIQMGPDGNLWVLHNDTPGMRGADEIGRYVYAGAPNPGIELHTVSNHSVGGAITFCLRASLNDFVISWISLSSYAAPVPTPFGPLWVPIEMPLGAAFITADDRAYLPLPVPNNAIFSGITLFAQGARLDLAGAITTTANFDSKTMW